MLSVKFPARIVERLPKEDRSRFIRDAVEEKLEREKTTGWKPQTATGRKLAALRAEMLARGGDTLDAEGIARELRERRGGVA